MDFSFPSYLLVPASESSGIDRFTLTKLRCVGDEEKTIPSGLDNSSTMIAPPVLPQSAFCALKKADWQKLDRFKFLRMDIS